MAQIAQQDHRIVTTDNSYYKERGYPFNGETELDYNNEVTAFVLYKAWKLGVFYDTILQLTEITDETNSYMFLPLYTSRVQAFYYKEGNELGKEANKLAGLIVFSPEANFEMDEATIARYDEILQWEQNRPAAE